MQNLCIYLSGNMTPSPTEYVKWVTKFNKYLKEYELQFESTSSLPMEDIDGPFIVQHGFARLKRSDILVVNSGVKYLEDHLTGSVVEIYEAWRQNKPVYSFCGEGLVRSDQFKSPWIRQFITKNFDSMDDLLYYLRFNENLPGLRG